MRIACISLYPTGTAPGSRFRYEQYLPLLRAAGIDVEVFPLLDAAGYGAMADGHGLASVGALAFGYLRRANQLLALRSFEAVWLYREATPFGPPIVEWMVRHLMGKPIVYDFDDAIWLAERPEGPLVSVARWRSKIAQICRVADTVVVGNAYLKRFADQHAENVVVVPTTVDVINRFNAVRLHRRLDRPIIGWTGSRSTNRYLDLLAGTLAALGSEVDFAFRAISDRRPDFGFAGAEFVPWSPADEIAQLLAFDIGVMPLEDTAWTRGKCGFKLIQYMALGIPVVASAVGANLDIIRDGIDGFLCASPADWRRRLRELVRDHHLRAELGKNARARVEETYSANRQAEALAAIFRRAVNSVEPVAIAVRA